MRSGESGESGVRPFTVACGTADACKSKCKYKVKVMVDADKFVAVSHQTASRITISARCWYDG